MVDYSNRKFNTCRSIADLLGLEETACDAAVQCPAAKRSHRLMGRDKRNESRGEHFARLPRSLMETDAWRALSSSAQALYPWLKLEWHGPKANNNGRISLSVRQAAQKLGMNPKTMTRAFHDLQAKGFIAQTKPPVLGLAGAGESPCYELTEIELPNANIRGGRALYKQWVEGQDFPVLLARSNNPTGHNGKNMTPTP